MFHQSTTLIESETSEQLLCAVFEQLGLGICLLDRYGHVMFESAEFRQHRDRSQALFVGYNGGFSFRDDALQAYLHELVSNQIDGFSYAIPLEGDQQDDLLCIEGVRLTEPTFCGYALLTRNSSRQSDADPKLLRDAYGFTRAEAEVGVLVCKGLTNCEIADERCRSVDTINAQMKSILRKSDSVNRTELVRKIVCLAA